MKGQPDQIAVFNTNAPEYDHWFDRHPDLYTLELDALRKAIPDRGTGIEIGVGTGRFAAPLHIRFGVEPAEEMARLAEKRGITVYRALAEDLPIADQTFDFCVMVTALCFFSDAARALQEAERILRPGGKIIVAIIDKNSEYGRKYMANAVENKFYTSAGFYGVEEVRELLTRAGFGKFKYWQTLRGLPESTEPISGYGQGSFVVIRAEKMHA